jgi:hypothetical protein
MFYEHLVPVGTLLGIGPDTCCEVHRILGVQDYELAGIGSIISGIQRVVSCSYVQTLISTLNASRTGIKDAVLYNSPEIPAQL